MTVGVLEAKVSSDLNMSNPKVEEFAFGFDVLGKTIRLSVAKQRVNQT
jgi:hypothetical protein